MPVAVCLSASEWARGLSGLLFVLFKGATALGRVSDDGWGVLRLGAAAGSSNLP